MVPLLDMMLKMQNGEAVKQVAEQFQLTQQQASEAMEALMPAFSEGLKRNTSDPYGVANFMNALVTGQHGRYWENMQQAFQPQGVQEGNSILGHLFGSPEVSRAIAKQAEAATGISQDIYKRMMPVMADLVMGGLSRQAADTASQAGSFSAANNPIGDIIEQMMRQGTDMFTGNTRQQPTPRAEPQNPFDNPFGKMLEGMFGDGAAQQAPQAPQNPMGDNPLGRIFEEMMKGGFGGTVGQNQAPSSPSPQPQSDRQTTGRTRNPYDDLFGEMFESGRRTRDQYEQNIGNIFDQFLRGMDRHR